MRMKCVGAVLALLSLTSVASAQQSTTLGGHFDFRTRALVGNHNDSGPYDNIYSTLRLKLHSDISDYVMAHVSGDLRLYARSSAANADDLSDVAKQYDVSGTLWEAYFDVLDLVEGLELRFGKQRIAWGKADKFNPTDNLNPDDLSDILEFGNHVPSLAVSASYTFNDMFALDVIWLPSPRAVLMPRTPELRMQGELDRALAPTMGYLGQLGLNPEGMPGTTLSMPAFDIKHSMQALKLKGTLGKVDYSLSYFHGYDDIPVPGALDFDLNLADVPSSSASIDMQLMEMHVIGLDLAGELAGMGWWAEGALFIPSEQVFTSRLPNLIGGGEQVLDAVVIDNTPYVKATVGIDYTFKCNLYVNLQYVHGLFLERGSEDNIYDYLFLRAEQKLFHDKLKLSFTAGGGIMDFSDVHNNWALLLSPKLEWSPFESMHIAAGAVWLEGKSESGDSLIATMDGYDMVFVNFKVNF